MRVNSHKAQSHFSIICIFKLLYHEWLKNYLDKKNSMLECKKLRNQFCLEDGGVRRKLVCCYKRSTHKSCTRSTPLFNQAVRVVQTVGLGGTRGWQR